MEKINLYTRGLMVALFSVASLPLSAQTGGLFATGWESAGNFFIAIIAGVLLAAGFQFLLTNLSVASGISMIGNVKKKFNNRGSSSSSGSDSSSSTSTGVKITSTFGIWTLITMSLSLFFASLLAVRLSLIANNWVGLTLGLVIWASFFLLTYYLEMRSVSSLAGSVIRTASSGITAGAGKLGNILSKSEENKAKSMAQKTVRGIREELHKELDTSDITRKLDEYVDTLKPKKFSLHKLEDHIASLLDEIEVEERLETDGDPHAIKKLFLDVAREKPNISKKDLDKLSNLYDRAQNIRKQPGSRVDRAMSAVDQFSPGSEEEARRYRHKVENYLRNTNREELQPENIKNDINEILHHPSAAPQVIRDRARKIDRESIVTLLDQREDMSHADAERIVSRVENAIESLTNTFTSSESTSMDGDRREKAKMRIRNWFNRMDQPELRYERIKNDIRIILSDPTATPEVLRNRFRKMDRESFVAIVSNNKRISEEEARHLADRFEAARHDVIAKAEEVEEEVRTRTEQAKQYALQKAENTRKTAASAAWWLFATAVVSGAASAIGGMLAYTF